MIIDLSDLATAIDGKRSQTKLATIVANDLVNQPFGPAEKFYAWAEALIRFDKVEIFTPDDVHMLMQWILDSTTMTILVKVQATRAIQRQLDKELEAELQSRV